MTYEETRRLLQRFMDGQTSHEEEICLKERLNEPDCPAEWNAYRLLLQMPAAEPAELLPQDEADAEYERIVKQRQSGRKARKEVRRILRKHVSRTIILRAIGIAAVVAIVWAWAARWEKPAKKNELLAVAEVGTEPTDAPPPDEAAPSLPDEVAPSLPDEMTTPPSSSPGLLAVAAAPKKASPLDECDVLFASEGENEISGTSFYESEIHVAGFGSAIMQDVSEETRKWQEQRAQEKDELTLFLERYISMQELLYTKYYAGECTQEQQDSIVDFFREQHSLQTARLPFKGIRMNPAPDFRFSYSAGITKGMGRQLTMLSDDGQCRIYCQITPRGMNNSDIIDHFTEEIQYNGEYTQRTTRRVAQWTKDYLDTYAGNNWTKTSGADSVYVWKFPQPENFTDTNDYAALADEDETSAPTHSISDHAYGIAFRKAGRPVLRVWMFTTNKGKRHLRQYIKEISESISYSI